MDEKEPPKILGFHIWPGDDEGMPIVGLVGFCFIILLALISYAVRYYWPF